MSTAASTANSAVVSTSVSSYFNKDKFWFSDPRALQTVAADADVQSTLADRLLNVANVGRKPISVITRKSDLRGFDVIANEYFGAGKVPDFMRGTDFVSDYLVDVIVVEGDYSDYAALSLDPVFGPYFDDKGLKKTIVTMLENNMIDAIVSTGANIVDQDFFEGLGFKHYIAPGSPEAPPVDDPTLRDMMIDRIYDTYIDADDLRACAAKTHEIFNAFVQDTKGNYTFRCINSSATLTYSFGAINCGTATAAQVAAAEQRLGITLPPDQDFYWEYVDRAEGKTPRVRGRSRSEDE